MFTGAGRGATATGSLCSGAGATSDVSDGPSSSVEATSLSGVARTLGVLEATARLPAPFFTTRDASGAPLGLFSKVRFLRSAFPPARSRFVADASWRSRLKSSCDAVSLDLPQATSAVARRAAEIGSLREVRIILLTLTSRVGSCGYGVACTYALMQCPDRV